LWGKSVRPSWSLWGKYTPRARLETQGTRHKKDTRHKLKRVRMARTRRTVRWRYGCLT